MTLVRNRADAARQLIAAMPDEIDGSWLFLAVPQGGRPLAAPPACGLGAELDLLSGVRDVMVVDHGVAAGQSRSMRRFARSPVLRPGLAVAVGEAAGRRPHSAIAAATYSVIAAI